MSSEENKLTNKSKVFILGVLTVVIIGICILTHEAIISGINADQSSKQLIKDLPCNWLKIKIDNLQDRWILSSEDQYTKQIYSEKCNK